MVVGSFPFGVHESGLIFQPGAAVVLPAWHVVQGAQPLDLGGIGADDDPPGPGVQVADGPAAADPGAKG